MPYFKRTTIFKSILFSPGMALFVMFLVVFMGFGLFSIIGKSITAASARKVAETQAASLKQKDTDMSKKLAALNTEAGQEAALREQYPVVKPGEHVVVITDQAPAAATLAVPTSENSGKGFWSFLKNLFK